MADIKWIGHTYDNPKLTFWEDMSDSINNSRRVFMPTYGWNIKKHNGDFFFGSKIWMKYIEPFSKDSRYIRIKNDSEEWNIIDIYEEKIISNEWFWSIDNFPTNYNLTKVQRLNGRYNYLNKNGSLLLKEDAIYCSSFNEGYGIIRTQDNNMNFISPQGEYLLQLNNCQNIFYLNKRQYLIYINERRFKVYIDLSNRLHILLFNLYAK